VAAVTGSRSSGGHPCSPVTPAGLSSAAAVLLDLLGPVPSSTDALVAASTLPAHAVMAAVGELVDRNAAVVTPHGVVRA
jgi:hypothetical protein